MKKCALLIALFVPSLHAMESPQKLKIDDKFKYKNKEYQLKQNENKLCLADGAEETELFTMYYLPLEKEKYREMTEINPHRCHLSPDNSQLAVLIVKQIFFIPFILTGEEDQEDLKPETTTEEIIIYNLDTGKKDHKKYIAPIEKCDNLDLFATYE